MAAGMIKHFPEEDRLLVHAGEGKFWNLPGRDGSRHMGQGPEENLLWVWLPGVRDGVNLDMLSGEQMDDAAEELEQRSIGKPA